MKTRSSISRRAVLAGTGGIIVTPGRWCIEAGGAPGVSTFGVHYVTRTESGLATRIMRFNASTASATSPC